MRTLIVLSLASSLALAAAGCSRDRDGGVAGSAGSSRSTASTISPVTVDDLDRMLASHACQAVDANGDATRRRMGVIPGAVLLRDMDAVDQLPPDKTASLVFYCANTACGASHQAADAAIAAGYTHVKVLPEGIAGWVKAGKATTSI
jgi:rhodanese-related sulfurtransferase